MSKTPPPPELVEVYGLIKAGNRQEAGKRLKQYLAINPNDINGWWLMAHTVSKPDNVRKCLERILAMDPNHAKARAKLQSLPPAGSIEPDDTQFRAALPPMPLPTKTVVTSYDSDPFGTSTEPLRQAFGTPPPPPTEPFVDPNEPPRPKPPKPHKPSGPQLDATIAPRPAQPSTERVIKIAMIAIAVVALIGVVAFVANQMDWVNLWGEKPVQMTSLSQGAFTMDVPEGWDVQCLSDPMGNPVCGIANHAACQDVEYYTGREVDLGAQLMEMFQNPYSNDYEDLPDTCISVIIMDVTTNSPAYDPASYSMTAYNDAEAGYYGFLGEDFSYDFDKQSDPPRQINGRDAYYYHFTSEYHFDYPLIGDSSTYTTSYDVYIPYGDRMVWLFTNIFTGKRGDIPDDILEDMINSIQITETPS